MVLPHALVYPALGYDAPIHRPIERAGAITYCACLKLMFNFRLVWRHLELSGGAMNIDSQVAGRTMTATNGTLAAALAVMLLAPAAHPQPIPLCGTVENHVPVIKSTILNYISPWSNPALECAMWQSFIHLNWPAREEAPGSPNEDLPFGSPGPTVWQTFKRHDQVFLTGGTPPGPWRSRTAPQIFSGLLADRIVKGDTRLLRQTTKFSPDFAASRQHTLERTYQARGGVLIDQNGQPVYYEMLLNEDLYEYIVRHGLYAADSQLDHARHNGIELPTGRTDNYGPTGTIEIKAAWKVLKSDEFSVVFLRF